MKNIRESKGITLIALVVTIIVLLILAAVTIGLVLGQNGIIGKANKAKNATDIASGKDQVQLALAKVVSDKLEAGKTTSDIKAEELQTELQKTDSSASVTGTNPNFTAKYHVNGIEYKYGIDTGTQTVTAQESGSDSQFNKEEWDKTATGEDYFVWGSDVEGEEGYHTIVGYQEKMGGLYKIRIPSRCTSIEINDVFLGLGTSRWGYVSNITKVEVPETVTIIGDYAFQYFTKMESIDMPNSVITIGACAFDDCSSLNTLKIPDSVLDIEGAFSECVNMISIEISENVKSIGEAAFWNCINLKSVTFKGNISPTFGLSLFGHEAAGYCPKLETIYIPSGSRASYEETLGMQTYDGTHLVKDLLVEI